MTDPIRFTLDGAEVEAQPGETIWQVANRQAIGNHRRRFDDRYRKTGLRPARANEIFNPWPVRSHRS